MEYQYAPGFEDEIAFKKMMDPFPIMVRACGPDGTTCYLNAAWKPFAVAAANWNTGMHDDYRLAYHGNFANWGKQEKAFKFKYRYHSPDGTYHWLAEDAVPWYAPDRRFMGFVCYTMDLGGHDTGSNQELTWSESRFRYLIREAPVAIGVLRSRNLIIEIANDKILEVWGKTPAIIGMPLHLALPEIQDQPFLKILDDVYTGGKPFYANEIRSLLEHEGILKEMFFNLTYKPVLNAKGLTSDILVVAIDVTEQVNSRRKLEQSEQHFRYLADLVPAKISNALPGGELTFFNKQWLEFAGMGFEDLRDFGYHQMMHPDEVDVFKAGLAAAAAAGTPYISEMRFKNLDGQYIWHLNVASPILDETGKITMWVGSTTDIHSLKAEEQRKMDFISMLSHELKTPVTSIKGHVQLLLRLLQKEAASTLTGKLRPSLSRIDRSLGRLTGLISDMLNMTRIDTGSLTLLKQRLSLDVLVEDIVADFRLSHQQYHFRVHIPEPVDVMADRHKLSQVLINLIDNAVKYAPNSFVVDIKVFRTNGAALIQVRDYGIGIEAKDQHKIFDRFYRVEGRNELQYSGFGIGLYLVKSIVDVHGGTVAVKSVMGEGSTFTVQLPGI